MSYQFIDNLEKERYNSFIEKHKKGHFAQTNEWGEFKSLHEWDMQLVGLEKNGKLVAATLLLIRILPAVKKPILYAPRGFVIDFHDKELLREFTSHIKEFGKKKGAVFIKIDPDVLYRERDIEGNIIDGGINNQTIIDNLKELGYKHKGTELNFSGVQPRFSFRLPIDKSEEDILDNFHHKTRYNIRLAERKGIEIVEGTKEDLKRFEEIMRVTGKRDGFVTRPLSYFEEMYDKLVPAGQMKLFLAKYNLDTGIEKAEKTVKDITKRQNKEIKKYEKATDEDEKQEIRTKLNQINVELIQSQQKRDELVQQKKENPNGLIISGAILTVFGDTAWYLYGASDNIYRNLMPNYLLQWEMIHWSKQNGCKMYDFRGISGDLSEDNPLYGLYRFKKGFNGEFTEYIGEFDLVLNKSLYYAWEKAVPAFKKVRKKLMSKG